MTYTGEGHDVSKAKKERGKAELNKRLVLEGQRSSVVTVWMKFFFFFCEVL